MKNLLLLSLLAFLFSACKKNGQDKSDTATVTINGEVYPTVTIGEQEWTSINYNGPDGFEANFSATDAHYKKYYSLTDLKDLKLPAGWRIPTVDDYNKLMSHITTRKDTDGNYAGDYEQTMSLRSVSGWEMKSPDAKQGTNSIGFDAYPAGYYTQYPQSNQTPGSVAMFLTSTPLPFGKATDHGTYYTFAITQSYASLSSDDKTDCFSCFIGRLYNNNAPKSVRFVRDK